MSKSKVSVSLLTIIILVSASFFIGTRFETERIVILAGKYLPHYTITWILKKLGGPENPLEPSRFVRQSDKNKKILVFMHGVGGDVGDTWMYNKGDTHVYWPELVKSDDRFKDYDIFAVSYFTPQWNEGPNIFQLARAVNSDLKKHDILPKPGGVSQYKEVVFICHSMGNLVIRTAMVTEPPDKNSNTEIPLILSIASPSKGSSLTDVADQISDSQTLKEMAAIERNSFLLLLNAVWERAGFDAEIACAYEKKKSDLLGGIKRIVVDKESATAICTREGDNGINEDHISIVKPSNKDHPTHKWLVKEIFKPGGKKGWEHTRWTNNEIIVGGKDYNESNIHAAMIAVTIRAEMPNLKVTTLYNMGNANRVFAAMQDRKIDIYPEYDGSLLYGYLDRDLSEPAKKFDVNFVNQELRKNPKTVNMVYLPDFGFHNPYVLVMLRSKAEELGLLKDDGKVTISELLKVSGDNLILKGDQGFYFRRDGYVGLEKVYTDKKKELKFKFFNHEYIKHSDAYNKLRESKNEAKGAVIVGYGTDHDLFYNQGDLIKIIDDKNFFRQYHPGPLVNKFLIRKFEKIKPVLMKLKDVMTAKEMSDLLGELKAFEDSKPANSEKWTKVEKLVRDFLAKKRVITVTSQQ